MHGIVRILMDPPELTGIDRELATGRSEGTAGHCRSATERAQPGFRGSGGRVRFALEQRGFPCEIVRAVTAACRRRAAAGPARGRGAAADATPEDFQALAVLFKRVKNIAKELPRCRRSTARR